MWSREGRFQILAIDCSVARPSLNARASKAQDVGPLAFLGKVKLGDIVNKHRTPFNDQTPLSALGAQWNEVD